jgi:hypothetical protein
MKKLLMLAALAAIAAGCGVKKITYEKKVDNEGVTTISYRIYQNDHWLNTKASAFKGGMTSEGKFEFQGEGLQSSPSEEFNRAMQTYTTAFVQLAQIAAAAYNPSASMAAAGKESTTVNVQVPSTGEAAAKASASTSSAATQSSDPHAADCTDGNCSDGSCTDGSCTPEVK